MKHVKAQISTHDLSHEFDKRKDLEQKISLFNRHIWCGNRGQTTIRFSISDNVNIFSI